MLNAHCRRNFLLLQRKLRENSRYSFFYRRDWIPPAWGIFCLPFCAIFGVKTDPATNIFACGALLIFPIVTSKSSLDFFQNEVKSTPRLGEKKFILRFSAIFGAKIGLNWKFFNHNAFFNISGYRQAKKNIIVSKVTLVYFWSKRI